MKGGESISKEILHYSKNRNKYWLSFTITPVYDNKHKIQNFVSIQSDITAQKEYEAQITTIARELSGLIENSSVPIFGIDRNGYINEWNQVTSKLTQFSKNEVFEKKWIENFIESPYREPLTKILAKVLTGKAVNNFELPILTKDLRRKILLLSLSPRWDTDNQIKGAIIVAQNVTELIEYRGGLEKMVQERTNDLNEALQKERKLVELKAKFVSMASHEFRTPLTSISLSTDYILKNRNSVAAEDVEDKLKSINKQVDHMNYLLEDVLTISKNESGKVQVHNSIIIAETFFRNLTQEIYLGTNKSHQIRLSLGLSSGTFYSDARMIRIIIVNLLTNAIKFSPFSDFVELRIADAKKLLTISVIDEGMGIPEDDLENIFNSFQRGSNVESIQGTGLGLSIVRKTVELLNGSIQVKSKIRKGTTFTIFLPTATT
jgi:PAS domain S-box-containing protein